MSFFPSLSRRQFQQLWQDTMGDTASAMIGDPLAPQAQPVCTHSPPASNNGANGPAVGVPAVVQVELIPLLLDAEIKTEGLHRTANYCPAASIRLAEPMGDCTYTSPPPPPPYPHQQSYVVQPAEELTASLLRDHGVMDEELEQMCALYQLNGRPNSPNGLTCMPNGGGQMAGESDFVDLDSLLDQTAEKYLVDKTATTPHATTTTPTPADPNGTNNNVLFSYLTTGQRSASIHKRAESSSSGGGQMMTPPASPEQEQLSRTALSTSSSSTCSTTPQPVSHAVLASCPSVNNGNTTLNPVDLNLISIHQQQRVITPPSSPDFDLPDR